MKRLCFIFISAIIAIALIGFSGIAYGQFGKLKDKVKGKVEDKADEKVEKKIDETIDKAAGDDQGAAEKPAEESKEAKEQPAAVDAKTGRRDCDCRRYVSLYQI